MIEFHFDHTDFQSLLRDLAGQLGADLKDGTLYFKPGHGEGFVHAHNLPNGLSILISKNALDIDVYLHRKSTDKVYYILNFDEIFIHHKYVDIEYVPFRLHSTHFFRRLSQYIKIRQGNHYHKR